MSCFNNETSSASTFNETGDKNLGLALSGFAQELNKHALINVCRSEYENLVRISERVETVRRYLDHNGFITDSDIRTLLNIERKEEPENETV